MWFMWTMRSRLDSEHCIPSSTTTHNNKYLNLLFYLTTVISFHFVMTVELVCFRVIVLPVNKAIIIYQASYFIEFNVVLFEYQLIAFEILASPTTLFAKPWTVKLVKTWNVEKLQIVLLSLRMCVFIFDFFWRWSTYNIPIFGNLTKYVITYFHSQGWIYK